jgi:acyl-CoA thioester hydrolase
MMYFDENGISMRKFETLPIGPVVMMDEVEYYREMRLQEKPEFTISGGERRQ